MENNGLFSQEAETAFFSIILNNVDFVYNISEISPAMFSSLRHEILFNALSNIAEQELVPERTIILDYLESENVLEKIGGKEYLEHLYSLNFDIKNFEEYKRIIITNYKTKYLLSLSGEIPSLVEKNKNNIDALITKVRQKLEFISSVIQKTGTFIIGDLIDKASERIKFKKESPGIAGKSTGFKTLDNITGGFKAGDLWVIGARPSMGKTAFACNSMLYSAKKGTKSLIFSLEMTNQTIIERFCSIDSGVDLSSINLGTIDNEEEKKVEESLNGMRGLEIYLDSDFMISPEYIESVVRKYKKSSDIDVVFVDYIQLLAQRTAEQTHELGRISRRLKLLAMELEITVVIIAQLSRAVELREDKRPILSDIRQSGNLEEDPDLVAFIYRDVVYNSGTKNPDKMEFLVRKQRNGPIGTLNFKFTDYLAKIEEGTYG